MFTSQTEFSEIVLLFEKNTISKQMPFSEFEAILDNYATIPEFGGRTAKAAYLVVDFSLNITACVLFLVEFCDDGSVIKSWNVPLKHMAEVAAPGPDLGSGPISLACYSQCPIAWQQNATWDPNLDGANDFKMMVELIKENRLCLAKQGPSGAKNDAPPMVVDQPGWGPHSTPQQPVSQQSMPQQPGSPSGQAMPPQVPPQGGQYGPPQNWGNYPASGQWGPQAGQQQVQQQPMQNAAWPAPNQQWQQPPPPNWGAPPAPPPHPSALQNPVEDAVRHIDGRKRTATLLKKLRLRLLTLERAKNKKLAELKFESQKEAQHFKIQKRRLQSFINSLTEQNSALKVQLTSQKTQIDTLEQSMNVKLEQAVEHEEKEIMALKQNFQRRTEESEVEEIAHLKEIYQVKQMELLYKEEITNQLRDEVVGLRRDKIRLVDSGADNFLNKLDALGISFINFHPGAGHLSIPLEDMSKYMDDTEGYVAEKCLVTKELYSRWLSHYNHPACQCESRPGAVCGERVPRQQTPSQYIEGETDRCTKHKSIVANDGRYKNSKDSFS